MISLVVQRVGMASRLLECVRDKSIGVFVLRGLRLTRGNNITNADLSLFKRLGKLWQRLRKDSGVSACCPVREHGTT